MAESTTVARPYARAAFEFANRKKGGLKRWTDILSFAAAVAAEPAMRSYLASPGPSAEEKANTFVEVCGSRLTKAGNNFIQLLAENGRLAVLPEIASLYEVMRAEEEKTLEAEMISAFPVEDAQRDAIAKALSARLEREVTLNCSVDESLLGGAIIRAGDLVIDGSAKGKLAHLATVLRK